MYDNTCDSSAQHRIVLTKKHSFTRSMSKRTILTCLFGAFAFLQFTVLQLANHAGEGYLTPGQREYVYYALQVFVILGFLLYSLSVRLCEGERIRRGTAYIVFGFFFACVAVMVAAGSDSLLNVIVSMASVLCLGWIGGAVFHRMSMETTTGAGVAWSMGIGSAAAVVLQYLLQIRWSASPLLPVFMAGAFFLCAYLLLWAFPDTVTTEDRPPDPVAEGDQLPNVVTQGEQTHRKTPARTLVFSILITATFLLFAGFYNEYIHHLQIQSGYTSYNVYSWPRLMMVPGYLLFALIGDRTNGKYVPVTAICITLIALLNVVLTGSPGTYWLNMCLFYCVIAPIASYYLLTFWRLAPGTGNPAFWAPFGRMVDSGMVLVTGAINLSALPAPVVLGVDIAGVIVVILLMAAGGDLILIEPHEHRYDENNTSIQLNQKDIPELRHEDEGVTVTSAVQEFLSPEETIKRMQERYNLTPRETDVLRNHVQTEDTQAIISERLGIQVKTLQDYVTRIYRKTGVKSRAGLTDLYYKTRNGN